MSILYRIIQWTWGFPQTCAGFILYCKYHKCSHEELNGALVTRWPHKEGLSLGMFLFYSDDSLKYHEYGHSIQSMILGPFYLLFVGLPSLLWCNLPYFQKYRRKKKYQYSKLYCENWADKIGKKYHQI